MKKLLSVFIIVFIVICTLTSSQKECTIFVIGDSTAAEKDISKGSPERGWGMVLQGCFSENIHVDNHAVNGRSSISFINEGRWQNVLDKIKPGDYVFIQFGHNDEKHDQPGKGARFSKPGSTFDANLERYVKETREKGGIPVLFNCVARRLYFDKNLEASAQKPEKEVDDESLRTAKYDPSEEKVNTEYPVETHYTADGDYTASPYLVAKKLNVPFVDANRITHWIELENGVEGSRKLHMWLKPGEVASIPTGRKDNTHYNVYGAHVVANRLADAIGDAVPALKPYIRHYDYVVSAEGRGNYLTLQEAIDAVPAGQAAKILVLDGTWQKPNIPTDKKITLEKFSAVKIEK